MKNSRSQIEAFTRIELLILTATIGLLGLVFVLAQEDPAAKERQNRVYCMGNIKMLGLGLRMWANDNSGSFPMQAPAAKGGTREAIDAGETFRHFATLSNYLTEVKRLVCPSDDRTRAESYATLRNSNLSYFVGLDADETKPQMLLSGDRNLTNGTPLKNAVMLLTSDAPEGWTAAIHGEVGNVGLADGSARQTSTIVLRRQIKAQRDSTGPGPKRLQFPE